MKTKFLSIVLMVAVCLGLLLVPAVSTTLAGPLTAGHVITPSATKVGFSTPFTVDVSIDNSANDDVNTVGAMINFTPSLISVTGIVINPLWTLPTGNTSDNAKGTIDIAAGIMGSSSSLTTIPVATIYMVSNNAAISGIANIDIVSQPGVRESDILTVANGSILNWGMVVNATVKVGKAELTVDVSPGLKGDVNIGGVGVPASYPNVTKWDWDTVVTVTATNAAAGWTFDSWSGDLSGNTTPDTVTMSVDRNVTANFVELPPELSLNKTSVSFITREGVNPDDQHLDISNTGGKLLNWTVGAPPTWEVDDNWTYFNSYFPMPLYNGSIPGSWNNTLTMTVTGTSGDNYTLFGIVDPWITPHNVSGAQRTITGIYAVTHDIGRCVDQYTLDPVKQVANITVYNPSPNNTQAVTTWDYFGDHGWPYYVGKTWSYNVTTVDLMGSTTVTAYALVDKTEVVATPIANITCYHIIHYFNPLDPVNTTFKVDWWSGAVRNFVQTADGGTFDFPPMDTRLLTGMSCIPPWPWPDPDPWPIPWPPRPCDPWPWPWPWPEPPWPPDPWPPFPPIWLCVSPERGSLATGAHDIVDLSVNASGLAVGNYTGNFTISAPGVLSETVDVSLQVKPATSIDVCRNLPGNALMTNQTYVGDTFDVWVNFTSPTDGFNSIGLTDTAPDGWIVDVNKTWCTPPAYAVQKWGNEAEILWAGDPGGYAKGTNFSARYTVTVPVTPTPGINTWQLCPDSDMAWLEYYFGEEGPYRSCIQCENEMLITVPGDIVGETRDVNANELSDVNVMLLKAIEGYLRADSSTPLYENTAYRTGMYWEHSTKALYYEINMTDMVMLPDKWIDLTTPALLSAGYVFDFEGNYGLVPRACTMSYALKSVNLWLFNVTGHPEWKLDEWKAMDSIHSWQYPG